MNRSEISLLNYLRHANFKQRCASNGMLGVEIGRSPRTVNRALADLVGMGAVEVTYSRTEGPGDVGRVIVVNYEKAEALLNPPTDEEVEL